MHTLLSNIPAHLFMLMFPFRCAHGFKLHGFTKGPIILVPEPYRFPQIGFNLGDLGLYFALDNMCSLALTIDGLGM